MSSFNFIILYYDTMYNKKFNSFRLHISIAYNFAYENKF